MNLSYGHGSAITILAGTVAAAVIIGSALGVLRAPVVGAAVLASRAVSAVAFALAYFKADLTTLYGSGDTIESQAGALRWFSWTASLAGGLAAGLLAFGYLRTTQRRAERTDPAYQPLRWPAYLLAGAGAGPAAAPGRGADPHRRFPGARAGRLDQRGRPGRPGATRRVAGQPRAGRALRRRAHRNHRLRPDPRTGRRRPRRRDGGRRGDPLGRAPGTVEPVRADADDEPADADGSEQPGEPGRTAESNEPVNW